MKIVLLSALLLCASSLMTKERLEAQNTVNEGLQAQMVQSGNPDEVKNLSNEWFDDTDADRSHLLSRHELRDMGFLLTDPHQGNFDDEFNKYDSDKSGDLNRDEFLAAFQVYYDWQTSIS